MTFVDWLQESAQRFQTKPAPKAFRESLSRFYQGAKVRYYDVRTDGKITTTLCGKRVTFLANNHVDIKRATTLNGEEQVADWLLSDIDVKTVFWDVGAYHGHYAVLAGVKGATVVAFEPGSDSALVERNAQLNDVPVMLRKHALSDTEGTAALSGSVSSEQTVGGEGEEIQTVRGDTVTPQPDIVKIDVEGHERQVLGGMGDVLRNVDRIAIEVHDPVPAGAVMSHLESHGLSVVELELDRTQTCVGGYR